MALVVGDPITARYEVRNPATGQLTDATVAPPTVTRPDGSAFTPVPSPTHPATGTYDTTWASDAAGVWRWTYVATGTVDDTTDGAVYVWPVGTVVAWAPPRWQVAGYVPTRTLDQDSADPVTQGTFTDSTIPTAMQVDGLIADAVTWVQARTGTVDVSLYEYAKSVAAMRAAALVMAAYPVGDAEAGTNPAATWFAQAETSLGVLVTANVATGTDDGPGDALVGAYSFPTEVSWGDLYPGL